MENKGNIAMFGQKRVPSREGGVEIVVEELAARMVQKGYSVTCYNRRGHHVSGAQFDTNAQKTYRGIRMKSVPTIEKKGLAAVSASFFAALCCGFGNYDVVHIHAEGPAFFAFLPKWLGKKVIVTVHGLDWKQEKWKAGFGSKFIHQGERNAVRYANEIVVLSQATKEYFLTAYGRETKLIPNGTSRPQKKAADLIRKEFGLEGQDYILFLGRLIPGKGLPYLIEAFRNLETDKKLVIAGGSSDTDTFLREMHAMAAGDDRILFTGFVQGQILEELYSNAYVYTLPSDHEGMPLSLLEAMSYGNCCLVSDIPECADVVEDKSVTFRRADVDDLKEKLQFLCNHGDVVKDYRLQAADFICNKYSWDAVVDETLLLY